MIDRVLMIFGIFAIITNNEFIDQFGDETDPVENVKEFKDLSKQIAYGDFAMPIMTLGLALFLIVISRRIRRIKK